LEVWSAITNSTVENLLEILARRTWARALDIDDLPIATDLVRKLRNLGTDSIGELVRIIKYDQLAEEDHPELIGAVRVALTTPGNSAAVSVESAWLNLCAQNSFCSISEIASGRKCTRDAVLDLAYRAGVVIDGNINSSLIYIVPDPATIDHDKSRAALQTLVDRIRGLESREAKILESRMVEGVTLEQIGQDLDLTRERIRQIERRAKQNLLRIASDAEVIEAIIPVHFALENLGGRATAAELSVELGSSRFAVSIAIELAANHPDIQDLVLVSGSETHMPMNFKPFKKQTKVLELAVLESISEEQVSLAIGASGVKRGVDFLRSLGEINGSGISCRHTPALTVLNALENQKSIAVARVHPLEELEFGPWVTNARTPRAIQVVQAMLSEGSEDRYKTGSSSGESYFHSQDGVQNHLVMDRLFNITGARTSEHGLNELCKRFPEIFVRSGPARWGLIGAGALFSDSQDELKLDHGTTIDLLVEVVDEASEPIALHEIIAIMRGRAPEIKEMSVRLYLRTLHADRFVEKDGRFSLSDSYKNRRNTELPFGATIKILEKVLSEANVPLTFDEIIKQCQSHLPVDPGAIRSYLEQNYRDWFRKLPEGKYMRSEIA
jgi:RNA polymerase sigma factor (sigma-70 family)